MFINTLKPFAVIILLTHTNITALTTVRTPASVSSETEWEPQSKLKRFKHKVQNWFNPSKNDHEKALKKNKKNDYRYQHHRQYVHHNHTLTSTPKPTKSSPDNIKKFPFRTMVAHHISHPELFFSSQSPSMRKKNVPVGTNAHFHKISQNNSPDQNNALTPKLILGTNTNILCPKFLHLTPLNQNIYREFYSYLFAPLEKILKFIKPTDYPDSDQLSNFTDRLQGVMAYSTAAIPGVTAIVIANHDTCQVDVFIGSKSLTRHNCPRTDAEVNMLEQVSDLDSAKQEWGYFEPFNPVAKIEITPESTTICNATFTESAKTSTVFGDTINADSAPNLVVSILYRGPAEQFRKRILEIRNSIVAMHKNPKDAVQKEAYNFSRLLKQLKNEARVRAPAPRSPSELTAELSSAPETGEE